AGLPAATAFVECEIVGSYITDAANCATAGSSASAIFTPIAAPCGRDLPQWLRERARQQLRHPVL
ncbi:MAG TPA: hypothetical protein VII31_05990, partial [Caldimonas sp.]